MRSQRLTEIMVGMFLVFALAALLVLAFKVSGLTSLFPSDSYTIDADFDDIGGLKVRSPVKIGGVQIGQVSSINLDPTTFKANVKIKVEKKFNDIPDDSSAGIFTAGLLGDNYISITPMYSPSFMKNGSHIEYTHSAMILEKIIGQMIYKVTNSGNDNKGANDAPAKK